MSQANKQATPRSRAGGRAGGQPVLTITVPGADGGSPLKLKKKKATALTKAVKKVAKAADSAGLDVTSDVGVLAAAAAGKAAPPAPAGAASESAPAVPESQAPSKPAAVAPRRKPAKSAAASGGAKPAEPSRPARKRPVKRAPAVPAPKTSAEPTPLHAGVGTQTGAPAVARRRVLKRTPARPPVAP